MSNQQASAASQEISSLRNSISTVSSNIQGDYSRNSGSNNVNSRITTNNFFAAGNLTSREAENLQCLYTSGYEPHLGLVREPTTGTCVWVTEHQKYRDWLLKRMPALLWLSADPGCGKSVIAAFLARHPKTRPAAIVCYFFFKDDNDEQRSPALALCGLLQQLFRQRNVPCKSVEEAFNTRGMRFAEELET